jgi:hypothetical protein
MRHKSYLTFVLPFAALLVCAGSRQASAQLGTGGTTGILGATGGTTGTGTVFATSDFFLGTQAVQGVNLSTFDAGRFFDVARCQCNTPVWLFLALLPSGFAKRSQAIAAAGNSGTITVWLGTNCVITQNQTDSTLCKEIAHQNLLTFLNQGSFTIPTDAQTISTYMGTSTVITDGGVVTTTGTSDPCVSPLGSFSQTVTIMIDNTGDGNPDLTITQTIPVDLQPPPAPTGVTVEGGNQALVMHWDQVDQSLTTDLIGYEILCSRADQYQVFKETGNDAGGATGPFFSGFESCPKARVDGGIGGIEALDPTFICSGLLSPVATSYRIETLQNDIYYAAAVVAIDNSGNPSNPPQILYGKPVRTLSFYDVYRDGYSDSNNTGKPDPGAASGGFCAVAAPRPRWRSTLLALGGVGIVAVGASLARRRRRSRR